MNSSIQKGVIRLEKLNFRSTNSIIPENFELILPNKNHSYRELSPMTLGPIHTNETNFPICQNLENFWQFSKCFPQDLEDDNSIGKQYHDSKMKGYLDKTPHRHKYKRGMKPLFTIFYDKDVLHKYQYIESRKFYCNHYEFLARKESKYKLLLEKLNTTNLLIKGYDGCSIDSSANNLQEILNSQYLNSKQIFGHEKVLFTMLCFDKKYITNKPWEFLDVSKYYDN